MQGIMVACIAWVLGQAMKSIGGAVAPLYKNFVMSKTEVVSDHGVITVGVFIVVFVRINPSPLPLLLPLLHRP